MTQTIRIEQYEVAPKTDGRNVSSGSIDWQRMWDVKVAFNYLEDAAKFSEYAAKYFTSTKESAKEEMEQTVDSLTLAKYQNMKGQAWALHCEVERLLEELESVKMSKSLIQEKCANLCELSYCKDKEQHLLLSRVAQHIREIK